MSLVSHLHQLFNAETCQSSIHTLRWKDRPLQCPRCQSHHVGPWGTYHAQPGLQRYRCKEKVASAPSMTSRARSWTAASARSCTGFWPLFCSVSPARRGALRGRWACISGPAIGGAGGYAMRRCPTRCIANSKARWKRMTSTTPPAPRGKRQAVARRRWGVARVGAGRNASLGGAIMTKTGRPSLPGSVARGLLSYRARVILPCRRCKGGRHRRANG
jgi:hypothetical protein